MSRTKTKSEKLVTIIGKLTVFDYYADHIDFISRESGRKSSLYVGDRTAMGRVVTQDMMTQWIREAMAADGGGT